MNDSELDQLLNSWKAPAPRRSLRDGLRARFPRAERLGIARALRWTLATVLASVALAVLLAGAAAVAQSTGTLSDLPIVRVLNQMYQNFLEAREASRATSIVLKVGESEPRVFVDGLPAAPLELGPSATMRVQVPGEGEYSITPFRLMRLRDAAGLPTGWAEVGRMHGNVIEFRAGGKQVRIECNQPIVDSDRPVFAMRRR